MNSKGILKNIDKFNAIKLAKGINLNNFGVLKRKTNSRQANVSLKKYGHLWFRLAKGNALFKTYDGTYKKHIKNVRIINELIVQNLAEQIGIKNAYYEPASIYDDYGLVTYNFLKENETLVTLNDFLAFDPNLTNNLVNIAEACDFYSQLGYTIDKEEIIFSLYKIMVLDALTLQTDRHNYNVNFIKNDPNHTFTVAPLFDSEFAFDIEYIFDSVPPNCTYKDILNLYSTNAKTLNVDDEAYRNTRYKNNTINLVNLAKSNEQMGEFMANALKKLSISKALKYVESLGVEISPEYKEYLTNLFQYTKRLFVTELKKPKTEDTSCLYEEYIK